MRAVVRLHGFRELEKALVEELPKATAKSVLRRTAINSMERVRKGMAERAPKDDGDLQASIKTKAVKPKRIPGEKRYARSNGVSYNTGPTGRAEGGNAAWQEFGTVHMPAHPYARPTADEEGPYVVDDVTEELTSQIQKAKARIARKAARASK